jgi:hypothetical protein
MQVSPVTMSHPSPRTTAPLLGIKDSLKEDARLFALGLFDLASFALRLLLWAFGLLDFWLFDVGGFCKGKELWKGKGLW